MLGVRWRCNLLPGVVQASGATTVAQPTLGVMRRGACLLVTRIIDPSPSTPTARCSRTQADAESAKLRALCGSQQALVGRLEAARRAQTRPRTAGGSQQLPPPPNAAGRAGALRLLVGKLREDGGVVGAHGLLADLVLLRRQCDEAAVAAVLGSALRDTVVVQTRADGARVVAEVRAAGIPGRIRCDVLDEMRRGGSAVSAGKGGGGGQGSVSGLAPLSECVTTSDPRHLPAAEKRLRGWYVCMGGRFRYDCVDRVGVGVGIVSSSLPSAARCYGVTGGGRGVVVLQGHELVGFLGLERLLFLHMQRVY